MAKNRAFLIAFRTLVASLSLVSLLMLSLQAFPKYRSPVRLVAARFGLASPPKEDAEPSAADDAAESDVGLHDPFSGSVSGNEASSGESVDDSLASSEGDVVASADAQQWDSRLTELERWLVDLKMEQSVHLGELRGEMARSLGQFESQIAELRTAQQRLESLEQQFSNFQESFAQENAAEPPVERIVIRSDVIDGKSRLVVEARDVSLAELLARLGETLSVNLVVDNSVTGNVSLRLELPNSVEALKEVCRLERCRHSQDGKVMLISRKEPPAETVKVEPPATMTKLYRLHYLTGAEIRPYVTVLLTPGVGTMGFANVRETAATTESRDPPRAILVKDVPDVLAAVDRLVQELDHPAAGVEKPAVNATPATAPHVPPPPIDEGYAAPMPSTPAPQFEQRSGCANCTSIAPPLVTPGQRHIRR